MRRLRNVDRKGRLHQASGRGNCYVVGEQCILQCMAGVSHSYTSSARRRNSITSKVTLLLGYLMDFVLLSLMTREAERISWFIPRLAVYGTKDNSQPFRTGIATINKLQDTHRYDDTLHCHEATRDKLNLMYLIIQYKIISCNKFSFLRKK